jgi:hypothetical protein
MNADHKAEGKHKAKERGVAPTSLRCKPKARRCVVCPEAMQDRFQKGPTPQSGLLMLVHEECCAP